MTRVAMTIIAVAIDAAVDIGALIGKLLTGEHLFRDAPKVAQEAVV